VKIPIYILSYKRSDAATTPGLMHRLGFENITLCVRYSERPRYKLAYPWCKLKTVEDQIGGLAETRQFLLEDITDDFYVMMDDDIRKFSFKPDPSQFGGLIDATPGKVASVFRYMQIAAQANKGFFAGSIPDRFTVARPSNETYKNYGFMRQCLFMGAKLRKHVRFDRLRVFMDIDYSLQIMKAGVPMQIARNMCVETPPDAYARAKGGLGQEREAMLSRAGSQEKYDEEVWAKIHKLHKDVIKLKPKRRIDWHGAYEIGLKNREELKREERR
jgi:hypothetical protein